MRGRRGTCGSPGALGRRWSPVAPRHFAWQACRLATSTCTLRVAGVALGDMDVVCVAGVALVIVGWLWWRACAPLVACGAAALWVAGVALGDMDVAFYVAGVAFGDIDVAFAWQGRRLSHWAGSGGASPAPSDAMLSVTLLAEGAGRREYQAMHNVVRLRQVGG